MLIAIVTIGRPAAAQRLAFRLFDHDTGLSNASIISLAQDSSGYLYAGTEHGVYRYDGNRFSLFGRQAGLPDTGTVESLRAAPDGRIWAVFRDRVYLSGGGSSVSAALDPTIDDEQVHRAAVLGRDLLLVRNRRLLRIRLDPDGTLSVHPFTIDRAASEAHGTAALSPDRVARSAPDGRTTAHPGTELRHDVDPVSAALAEGIESVNVERGTIWLGCGVAVCRLDSAGVSVIGAATGLPADHWIALLRDHEGTLWLRSAERIALLPRGATHFSITAVPGGPGRFANNIEQLDLVEDAAGRVVTQGAGGLLVYDKGRWVLFDNDESMSRMAVTSMLVDREGSLWIGSTGRGLARVIGLGLLESWNRAQGLSDDLIWNAMRDGAGTLWAASELAVDPVVEHVRAGTIASPAAPGAPTEHYPCTAPTLARSARGRLWIACQKGRLIRRDPLTGRSEAIAQLAPIHVMLSDPAGPLWIGTRHGLARIDRPDDPVPSVVQDVVPSMGRVLSITLDDAGDVWVLSEKTLFHRDSRQLWHPVLQTDPAGGYQTRLIQFASDGTLWLGSFTTGITRLRLDHGTVVGRDRLPSAHLASQEVEMMHRDTAGRMWIGTDQGLDVTDGTHWRHLDSQDGLAANDINENASFTDDDGTPWFGTVGGLSHLIDTQGLFSTTRLHPVITHISAGGREVLPAGMRGDPVHLKWSRDPLVISFASLDFKFEKSIRFRYRLRGVDRGWVETDAHEARYPGLPSGKLVFEVMAIDPLHRLGSTPACVTIKVRPPWWWTWPVLLSEVVVASGALMLLWRLRISYLLLRQRQLEALVVERTHEIEQARLVLFKQANYDALTGLLNRPAVLERLQVAMEDAGRTGTPLALALLDLDHFKRINDRFGHLGGDAVLREVGSRLSASTREGDHAGRYGGEELLLVLPGLKHDAFERIEMLRQAVFAEGIPFGSSVIRVTCSVGVTWMRAGDDVTSMIGRADAALYAAKHDGRDCVTFDRSLT